MKGSHVHVGVKDLKAAVKWMDQYLALRPAFSNDRMAVISLQAFSVILDASDADTVATIAFDSKNCDEDFKIIAKRGVEVIEEPANQPWGVRAAYIKGPGELTFEIEQILESAR